MFLEAPLGPLFILNLATGTVSQTLPPPHLHRGPENEHKWVYRLTEDDIKEVEAALEHVKTNNLKPDVRAVEL